MKTSSTQLNFLPKEHRPRSKLIPILSMAAATLGIGLAMTLGYLKIQTSNLQNHRVELDQTIATLEGTISQQKTDEVKKSLNTQIVLDPFRSHGKWSTCFKEITMLIPEGLWLQEFFVDVSESSRSYRITGQSDSQKNIGEFFTSMEESFCFENVKIKFIERSKEFSPNLFRFQFDFVSPQEKKAGTTNAAI